MELTIRPIRRKEFPLLADFLRRDLSQRPVVAPAATDRRTSVTAHLHRGFRHTPRRPLPGRASGRARRRNGLGALHSGLRIYRRRHSRIRPVGRGSLPGTGHRHKVDARDAATALRSRVSGSLAFGARRNPAVRLYRRLGFRTVKRTPEEYIMACDLRDTDSAVANRTAGTE